jgi:predicted DCC family thiol-disulfide oxidoreductase YuxK
MNPRLEVYYDGSCRLCRAEIGALAAADSHGVLDLRDCAAASFDDSTPRAAGGAAALRGRNLPDRLKPGAAGLRPTADSLS